MAQPKASDLTFGKISVGEVCSVDRAFSAEDVDQFARLCGDFSPLHVDSEYASATEFGGRVVHGLLLASLFSQLVGMRIPGKHALYLGQDLSFRKPVRVGETVRASLKVTAKNEATRTILIATEIRNAENRVVVSGTAKVKVRDGELPAAAEVRSVQPARAAGAQRVAVVTGGSRGIGAEIARSLAARGDAVAVTFFRSDESARRIASAIEQNGGEAIAVQADVRSSEDVQRLLGVVIGRWGRIDLVVNAAIGELLERPAIEQDWDAFQEQLDYQVKAVLQVCQTVYPVMKAAGGGSIVNVLSQVVEGRPPAGMAAYVTAKHALHGLSKALAAEWASDFIRVNMVSPGLTQTQLTQHYPERVFKMEAGRTPLRRIAQPADIANAVAFLAGEEASFLTGVNLFVTGGQVMI